MKTKVIEYFQDNNIVKIGRSTSCQIILKDEKRRISREHALITRENNYYYIEDGSGDGKASRNGVYLNGVMIAPCVKVKISNNDIITIGPFELSLNKPIRDLSKETVIQARGIEKIFTTNNIFRKSEHKKALKTLSIDIKPQQFVAVMGPSGCGKSTLLKILSNNLQPTEGAVFIQGYKSVENFELLKRKIGFVPQDDIAHEELTVEETLYFSGRLRMGNDVDRQMIEKKIKEVLHSLFEKNIIEKIFKRRVKELSGGERKRINIAIELMTDPAILFLDEPTSPLDPETIKEFLNSLNRLKEENGTTIIMVTHKPEDLKYVDEVIFMGIGGYLIYKGTPNKIIHDLDCPDILEVYKRFSIESNCEAYHIGEGIESDEISIISQEVNLRQNKENLISQLWWQSRRYLQIKLSDSNNIILLGFQPIVIAGLISFVFRNIQIGVIFLMAISSIWFGVSNASKEIVGETSIFKREKMFNLNVINYLLSKILVLTLIAIIQIFLFLLVLEIFFTSDGLHLFNVTQHFLFMVYLTLSSTLLGLLLSSYYNTTSKVLTMVPIILIPQIMLSGVITKIDNNKKETLSYMTLGRWGTEGFAIIQDSHGSNTTNREFFIVNNCESEATENYRFNEKITESIYTPRKDTTRKSIPLAYMSSSGKIQQYTGAKSRLAINYSLRAGAMDMLDFYNSEDANENNNLLRVLLAIILINTITFFLILIILKNKK